MLCLLWGIGLLGVPFCPFCPAVDISEILPLGMDIAERIFRDSVIFVKRRGRYGYGLDGIAFAPGLWRW